MLWNKNTVETQHFYCFATGEGLEVKGEGWGLKVKEIVPIKVPKLLSPCVRETSEAERVSLNAPR